MPRIGKYGTPRVRDLTSEAYSSKNKNAFRTKLTVVLDFSDADRSIRSARRSMEDLNASMKDLAKKINRTDRGFGPYISVNAVKDRLAQGNQLIPLNIPGIENEAEFSASLSPFLTELGKIGKDIMKNKYATRRETGLMQNSVAYMQRRTGKTRAVVEIGWVRTWKKYFGWQEMGTSNGIKPMAAVIRTGLELQPKIASTYSKYFRKTFLEKGR